MRAILVLVFLLLAGVAQAQQSKAGDVVALKGNATAGGRALAKNSPVYVGETVAVAPAAKLKLRMVDGSVISLGEDSTLRLDQYQVAAQRNVQVTLGSGLLRAVIEKLTGNSRFEVASATGVAAVRSTDLFVEVEPQGMQLGVLQGSATLTSTNGRSVTVPEGWGARIEAETPVPGQRLRGRSPVPARAWSRAEFQDVINRTEVE